mgnify:CR=1 FL=1
MSDWIDELAEALGVEALTAAETDHILRVARDVAHRVERRDTPLASFLHRDARGAPDGRRHGRGTSRSTRRSRSPTRSFLPRPERP